MENYNLTRKEAVDVLNGLKHKIELVSNPNEKKRVEEIIKSIEEKLLSESGDRFTLTFTN